MRKAEMSTSGTKISSISSDYGFAINVNSGTTPGRTELNPNQDSPLALPSTIQITRSPPRGKKETTFQDPESFHCLDRGPTRAASYNHHPSSQTSVVHDSMRGIDYVKESAATVQKNMHSMTTPSKPSVSEPSHKPAMMLSRSAPDVSDKELDTGNHIIQTTSTAQHLSDLGQRNISYKQSSVAGPTASAQQKLRHLRAARAAAAKSTIEPITFTTGVTSQNDQRQAFEDAMNITKTIDSDQGDLEKSPINASKPISIMKSCRQTMSCKNRTVPDFVIDDKRITMTDIATHCNDGQLPKDLTRNTRASHHIGPLLELGTSDKTAPRLQKSSTASNKHHGHGNKPPEDELATTKRQCEALGTQVTFPNMLVKAKFDPDTKENPQECRPGESIENFEDSVTFIHNCSGHGNEVAETKPPSTIPGKITSNVNSLHNENNGSKLLSKNYTKTQRSPFPGSIDVEAREQDPHDHCLSTKTTPPIASSISARYESMTPVARTAMQRNHIWQSHDPTQSKQGTAPENPVLLSDSGKETQILSSSEGEGSEASQSPHSDNKDRGPQFSRLLPSLPNHIKCVPWTEVVNDGVSCEPQPSPRTKDLSGDYHNEHRLHEYKSCDRAADIGELRYAQKREVSENSAEEAMAQIITRSARNARKTYTSDITDIVHNRAVPGLSQAPMISDGVANNIASAYPPEATGPPEPNNMPLPTCVPEDLGILGVHTEITQNKPISVNPHERQKITRKRPMLAELESDTRRSVNKRAKVHQFHNEDNKAQSKSAMLTHLYMPPLIPTSPKPTTTCHTYASKLPRSTQMAAGNMFTDTIQSQRISTGDMREIYSAITRNAVTAQDEPIIRAFPMSSVGRMSGRINPLEMTTRCSNSVGKASLEQSEHTRRDTKPYIHRVTKNGSPMNLEQEKNDFHVRQDAEKMLYVNPVVAEHAVEHEPSSSIDEDEGQYCPIPVLAWQTDTHRINARNTPMHDHQNPIDDDEPRGTSSQLISHAGLDSDVSDQSTRQQSPPDCPRENPFVIGEKSSLKAAGEHSQETRNENGFLSRLKLAHLAMIDGKATEDIEPRRDKDNKGKILNSSLTPSEKDMAYVDHVNEYEDDRNSHYPRALENIDRRAHADDDFMQHVKRLEPHQRALHNAIFRIGHGLVQHLVEAEVAIEDVIEDYRGDCVMLLKEMEEAHISTLDKYFENALKSARDLARNFLLTVKVLERSRTNMKMNREQFAKSVNNREHAVTRLHDLMQGRL